MSRGLCKHCEHWNRDSTDESSNDQQRQFLECHRYPPAIVVGSYNLQDKQQPANGGNKNQVATTQKRQINGDLVGKILTYWPRTAADGFCGEFKQIDKDLLADDGLGSSK